MSERSDGNPGRGGPRSGRYGPPARDRGQGAPFRKRRPQVPAAMLRRLNVIHEDADVIVVDKPPGLLTSSPPDEDRDNLFDLVKEHARGRKGRAKRVWIIHRLDKEASGLLVFAKTEKAFEWLKEDFRAKRVHRLYLAVVEGEIKGEPTKQQDSEAGALSSSAGGATGRARAPQLPAGTIQSFIREGDDSESATSVALGDVAQQASRDAHHSSPRFPSPPPRPRAAGAKGEYRGGLSSGPKLAVTHWRVLAAGQGRSLVQLRLETGRKNQIRVHMQEFKHSIVGDWRYGSQSDPMQRLGLHASELGFTHPTTGQSVRYHSPAPEAFYRLVGEKPPPGTPDAGEAGSTAPAATASNLSTSHIPHPTSDIPPPAADTSWDQVASWYDTLIEGEKSDHFERVIVPGTVRLLSRASIGADARPGRVLDIACGQGSLARQLISMGMNIVGVDASPRLIEAARSRGPGRFEVGDARELERLQETLGPEPFDAAACVMALMNIDPLEPVFRGAAALLKPGGAFVGVILHPAFRAPGQTSWEWEEEGTQGRTSGESKRPGAGPAGGRRHSAERGRPFDRKPGPPPIVRQYRRVDGYLSNGQYPVIMNPGRAAHGEERVTTWTFHRPLQSYVKALADAGFLIEALEEWPSMRKSQPGPRASEENRARREIPMFLGFRAVKR